jgi:hypothetical protein
MKFHVVNRKNKISSPSELDILKYVFLSERVPPKYIQEIWGQTHYAKTKLHINCLKSFVKAIQMGYSMFLLVK